MIEGDTIDDLSTLRESMEEEARAAGFDLKGMLKATVERVGPPRLGVGVVLTAEELEASVADDDAALGLGTF